MKRLTINCLEKPAQVRRNRRIDSDYWPKGIEVIGYRAPRIVLEQISGVDGLYCSRPCRRGTCRCLNIECDTRRLVDTKHIAVGSHIGRIHVL